MPAQARSLLVTDEYRNRLRQLRARAVAAARRGWTIDPTDLDGSHEQWAARTSLILTELQRAGMQLSIGYLTAYLTSELRAAAPAELQEDVSGRARDGRPLLEALTPSLFTIKAAVGEGRPAAEAIRLGEQRAMRFIGDESIAPARQALADSIAADDRIVGWRRVTGGGCGACLAAATGAVQADDQVLEVHAGCQCSKEPVVGDVRDTVRRPSGRDMFDGLTTADQDGLLGHEKASLIRDGLIPFSGLVMREPMAVLPTGITERPLQDLQ